MSTSAWRTEDKAWVAERKRQWRAHQPILKLVAHESVLKQKAMKVHRELFMEGTVRGNAIDLPDAGSEDFGYVLPLFWIWYHPEPGSIGLNELRDAFLHNGRLDSATRTLFSQWTMLGIPPKTLPADHGLMGGREQLAVDFACPSHNYREHWPSPTGSREFGCISPARTLLSFRQGARLELRTDGIHIPHALGQFLWPHLVYAVEHYPDEIFEADQNGTEETKRGDIKRVLAEVLGFEQREDPSRYRVSTIAFVQRVLDRAHNGFSGAMADLWGEALNEQESLRAESAEMNEFKVSDKMAKKLGWTDEMLAERKAQWILE